MGLFSKKPIGGGIFDVIRCDEPDYLVWKWHPQGTVEGENRKENAIRWGSRLRVKEGAVAIFVYRKKDGSIQDYIEGPFDETLKTKNLPIISNVLGLMYEGESPFQAEVYFINLAHIIQVRFAVPYFDVYDPRFLDYGVPTAVRGTISFKITDYREFVKIHRLETFTVEEFQNQINDAILRYVKGVVSNAPEEYKIPVVQLERKLEQINEIVEEKIEEQFFNEFGVTISSVNIATIDVDKTSEGYQKLRTITQNLTEQKMQAKTEIEIKEMRDTQELGVLERTGRTVTNIREDAYARHKQTQTENLAAYQTETQGHVGVAGAHGLGMMGVGGGGNVSSGEMNPAAMMAGMAVGGTIGQNIAGTMNQMMGAINQQQMQTPPPVNSAENAMYHIVVDGQPTGPFDMITLKKMALTGELLKESLVWTAGMHDWQKAGEVAKLKTLFLEMPPIPKTNS